jgi:hypothetical protein
LLERGGGDRREGVQLRVECAQWADQLGAGCAGHAHVRRGPGQRGQAMLARGDSDVLPEGARFGACGVGGRVDLHALQA